MTIRTAEVTEADLNIICHHRRAMFSDMGYNDGEQLDSMIFAFRPWLLKMMEAGQYLTWFVIADDGTIAAGAGVWLMDWPPHMIGPGAPRANVLNVYTEPAYRRQGLAALLMKTILAWLRDNGIRSVILHASDAGRSTYERLGFTATNEMRLIL